MRRDADFMDHICHIRLQVSLNILVFTLIGIDFAHLRKIPLPAGTHVLDPADHHIVVEGLQDQVIRP